MKFFSLVNSQSSLHSRSTGRSIEELKSAAASRADSFYSPSSAFLRQDSISNIGLNVLKEPLKSRIPIVNSETTFIAQNVPISSGIAMPQANLRVAAQTINGLIQKDKIQPDLGELLNGTKLKCYDYYFIYLQFRSIFT